MNLATAIVIGVIVLAVVLVVVRLIRRRRAGISPYCASCSLKDTCSKK
ncbi:MAG: FeoB-associated Cys-rich membrane protein [Bacteroidales bacterium]|nr:FeoB-associated Cys-rich membrane protein [Bacteroidales bacterium]